MATVKEHYAKVLSDVYSWVYGGLDSGIQRNAQFFSQHQLSPGGSGVAVDLGAGSGFQSIPLAKAGYSVTAIDLDPTLLDELKSNAANLNITPVQGDLIDFDKSVRSGIELMVCMTDTLLHLDSKESVSLLFGKVINALEANGRFIMTFRDLTYELKDTDRFLPVKSDERIIFTCFLEYEPETVKVHDIVYKRLNGEWHFFKSFYRKLRLSKEWVTDQLLQCGFKVDTTVEKGLVTMIASKQGIHHGR